MIVPVFFVSCLLSLLLSEHPGGTFCCHLFSGVLEVEAVSRPLPPPPPVSSITTTTSTAATTTTTPAAATSFSSYSAAPPPPPYLPFAWRSSGARAVAHASRVFVPLVRGVPFLRFTWERPARVGSGPAAPLWPPPAPRLELVPWAASEIVGGEGQQQHQSVGMSSLAARWRGHSYGIARPAMEPNPEPPGSNRMMVAGSFTDKPLEEGNKQEGLQEQQMEGLQSGADVADASAAFQDRMRERTLLRKRMHSIPAKERRFATRWGRYAAAAAFFAVMAQLCFYVWKRKFNRGLNGAGGFEIIFSRVPRETQTDFDGSLEELSVPSSSADPTTEERST